MITADHDKTTTSTATISSPAPALPARKAVLGLLGGYLTLSWLTVAALIVLSGLAPDQLTPQTWVRGVIVAGTSTLTFLYGRRAAQRRPGWLLRLRIVVPVILVAVVAVLFYLPLPTWMIIEQAMCGVLLLITATLIYRATFAANVINRSRTTSGRSSTMKCPQS